MRTLRLLGVGLAVPHEDDLPIAVRGLRAGHLPALLRDGRLLRLPRRRQPTDARLRVARRGRDGHVVGDEHDRGRSHAARALARHARAARRDSSPLRARPPARDARDGHDRDLQPGRDPALRPLPVRDRTDGSASAAVRRVDRRHGAQLRRARLRLRGHVRPLPGGLGAREPLRVPRVADRRLPRPARAASRTGSGRSPGCSRRPGA